MNWIEQEIKKTEAQIPASPTTLITSDRWLYQRLQANIESQSQPARPPYFHLIAVDNQLRLPPSEGQAFLLLRFKRPITLRLVLAELGYTAKKAKIDLPDPADLNNLWQDSDQEDLVSSLYDRLWENLRSALFF